MGRTHDLIGRPNFSLKGDEMNATITKIPADPTRYRWVIVAVASVFMSMGVGSLWSISIFLKPIIAEFGWMRGETSLAFTAGTVSMGVGGILMGYLTDRYPIRWIVLAGALGLSASYLLLSRLTTPWEFYLYYCLLGGVGSAALWTPMLAIVGNWFEEKRDWRWDWPCPEWPWATALSSKFRDF